MKNTNSIIGFEENGGFFYGLLNNVRDGAITTALILEMLSYYKQNPSKYKSYLLIIITIITEISLSCIFKIINETYQYKSSLKLSNIEDILK